LSTIQASSIAVYFGQPASAGGEPRAETGPSQPDLQVVHRRLRARRRRARLRCRIRSGDRTAVARAAPRPGEDFLARLRLEPERSGTGRIREVPSENLLPASLGVSQASPGAASAQLPESQASERGSSSRRWGRRRSPIKNRPRRPAPRSAKVAGSGITPTVISRSVLLMKEAVPG
jgi:hypothetical protein